MTVKIIGNLGELMRKAKAVSAAKKSGNVDEIEAAQTDHDGYKAICLSADEVSTGMTYGSLAIPSKM